MKGELKEEADVKERVFKAYYKVSNLMKGELKG